MKSFRKWKPCLDVCESLKKFSTPVELSKNKKFSKIIIEIKKTLEYYPINIVQLSKP